MDSKKLAWILRRRHVAESKRQEGLVIPNSDWKRFYLEDVTALLEESMAFIKDTATHENQTSIKALQDYVRYLQHRLDQNAKEVEEIHCLLDVVIPRCETGTYCNDPKCQSKLHHRVKETVSLIERLTNTTPVLSEQLK
jgi:hypothetical protein